MEFKTRPGTTDDKVIDEVITRRVYEHKKFGFVINDAPIWLDLGGNIGTFTCLAAYRGCKVITFEPEPENFAMLKYNVKLNKLDKMVELNQAGIIGGPDSTVNLYVCKGDYNKYRHTIFKKRGRETIPIKVLNFMAVLDRTKANGVKIDIEGAEIELLESVVTWPDHVTHIVFEYSFDIDPSIARFKGIIDSLKKQFDIHHRKIDWSSEKYLFYPPAVIVYCKKNIKV